MLQLIVDWFIYHILRFSEASKIACSINFFIYDSIKIMLLLFTMISIIGFLKTFLPQKDIKKWLNKNDISRNLFASMFGAVTPFCSCSSIPIFFSFLKANISLGVAFSFLITSPIINEYLVVLMFGFFGWKITFTYILNGIIIGVFSGFILGKMGLEKYIVKDVFNSNSNGFIDEIKYQNFKKRVLFGVNEALSIIKKLWIWILIGVGIGALIHNYIPQESVHKIINKTGFFSVPIAVLLGVPLYGSCAAILPIAIVLFQKGVPLGTALSFMMAVSALSLPEAIILRRTMKLQLIAIFFGITTLAIIFVGYLFNLLQQVLI